METRRSRVPLSDLRQSATHLLCRRPPLSPIHKGHAAPSEGARFDDGLNIREANSGHRPSNGELNCRELLQCQKSIDVIPRAGEENRCLGNGYEERCNWSCLRLAHMRGIRACDPLTRNRGVCRLPNVTEKPGTMRELRHFWQRSGLVVTEHFGAIRRQSVG